MERTFYSVARISDGEIIVQTESDWEAAVSLVPGTTHGMGSTQRAANRKARAAAVAARKLVGADHGKN